ncbi:zinc metalloprotease HtpX [Candidatus Kaiserbacteria bacterium RIFCSPLOWO2_02_FULL_54_13]|uniref:Protease HtpX homolog n=1 Tax=Candidatus Kaiserbacteria bacterium RIFCSPHIGHO2_02_FULL_54_22 TaxID=1798495 RepID=A0A1F6DLV8_9BACT|nr:MAG: Protease HtpX-like protein [Parcubacteria group bacterium GW2011_GWA1_54_9]OGG61992.1 MAG: zinc metalloprotease HtpX [Candidatus Kaiserbacteria bacterium RIFCSPHIGHO2_02_FULL_54_22]OGG67967.1 MAG: zinc metalloprotease HtpX [Candidatus Kaiserbacteria bacterium RIFCSPHIGHO2_12_FULL_54_16]OGG82939.1 MAG: zinc metalloprotease HtpX [Candidatus Kaiserbacteria bacterium RIFCSPLOWO2_02_FULL_54_13]OGG90363.1 MAG: zinc metalloprotease HtpX [Candidatus Kaiserbacteria bacterium RIFCSPLOWO2_12_FULL_
MNLYDQRSSNIRRTWVLVLGFLIVVIAVGYAIAWYYGNPAILYIAVFIAVATNFYAYWQSDKLVLSLNHARPASREEFFDLYTVTENLAITAGLPKPKLYVIDDPAPNAFATGRDEEHAVVCATTGLLALLSRSELEGVIAHELSHIKNRDILLMTVAVVLAGFVAILADLFLRMSFWGGGRGSNNRQGNAIMMVLAVVGIVLAPIAAKLIQLAVSRRREFLADASGALLTRYPEGLASALQKISATNIPMRHASHATAHLFIDEPFGKAEGSKLAWLENMFATHPPISARIKALLNK